MLFIVALQFYLKLAPFVVLSRPHWLSNKRHKCDTFWYLFLFCSLIFLKKLLFPFLFPQPPFISVTNAIINFDPPKTNIHLQLIICQIASFLFLFIQSGVQSRPSNGPSPAQWKPNFNFFLQSGERLIILFIKIEG